MEKTNQAGILAAAHCLVKNSKARLSTAKLLHLDAESIPWLRGVPEIFHCPQFSLA